MRQFVSWVVAVAIGLLVWPAGAQTPDPRTEVRKGLVSVLTDSIADPGSRATRAINQLAAYANHLPNVRVLPISGRGAAANVRDLLYLRGVDFAVLNSDVLTYLDLGGQYPDARKRLRYVTHLYEQKVFVLARNGIDAFEGLRGRRLVVMGEDGPGLITAKSLLGLSKIDAKIEELGAGSVLDDASLARYDGALLLSDELTRARLSARMRKDYHLLPVHMTPELQKTYPRAVIEAQEAAEFSSGANIDTVTVSTLLAVFNWAPAQARYADVTNFIAALFSNIRGLRRASQSVWRQADVSATSPGWTRFPAVLPNQILTPAQLAEITIERPVLALAQPAPAPTAEPVQKTKYIKVLAAERAPLADRHLPDGGLITALVNSSLHMADQHGGGPSEMDINWTSALPIEFLQNGSTIDLSLPWESADCDEPGELAHASAMLCDDVLYSEPVLQMVVGLFALSDGSFDFNTDESIVGKSICVPLDRDASVLNSDGRKWLLDQRISLIRRPTLLECISLTQQREADAFVASDLEGRYALGRLGLSEFFKMMERPLATHGVHVIVPKAHPRAEELISTINQGLKQLKQSDAYSSIIRQHLVKLWNTRASAP